MGLASERKIDVSIGDVDLNPVISILVPVFNAEDTLNQALDSIRSQSGAPIEIICIDDASSDKSLQILKDHLAQDSRLVILRHHQNAGYGASLNDGLAKARGKWIAILEPDDYIKGSMYETMLNNAANNSFEPDVIKTPYYREVRDEGTRRGEPPSDIQKCSFYHRIPIQNKTFDLKHEPKASHLLRHHPSIWSALYRKDFLNKQMIRFIEYPGAGWADNEYFYKTMLYATNILYIDQPFYVYREETTSEFKRFRANNQTLPFMRWLSMQDIIDGLENEVEPHVIRAHVATGFTYLRSMGVSYQGSDSEVRRCIDKMFTRMDPDAVMEEASIPPSLKKLYLKRMNDLNLVNDTYSCRISSIPYYKSLIGEFLYSIKSNGLRHALRDVASFLR